MYFIYLNFILFYLLLSKLRATCDKMSSLIYSVIIHITFCSSCFFMCFFNFCNISSFFNIHLLSAGLLPASALLIAVGYAGCSHVLAITFLTLSLTLFGLLGSGVYINQIDIAPQWVLPSIHSYCCFPSCILFSFIYSFITFLT